MVDGNIPNNGNILNNGNSPNNVQLSPDLQKVLDSLTPRQRMRYEASQSKIDILEIILDERNKSEVWWELITVVIYAAITISLTVVNVRYFNTDDSTKAFSIIISSPIMVGLLVAVTLGIYVQSPLITTKFINVGLEMSKVFISLIAR
ncbi:1947_t:CDS:2 [Rhizophagus irregularis]|uniref:Uncharacterized protein n=1 Tax=Rhizophagus irregularis (strain DAOM 181602 / DAOM 197198 / MUCL 43194) TaxID=747089 RepID=U9SPP5_RHIID|nr:1947_t:CDS:2 [Rhizophagus irregularis]